MFVTPLALLAAMQGSDPLAVVVDDIRTDQDIQHYHVAVDIPDTGTGIRGATSVRYVVKGGLGPLVLNFDAGFTVDSIVPRGGPMSRAQVHDAALRIDHWGNPGVTLEVTVFYHGSPQDGLFIQDNVHGDRTAFADNFPDRARHWFPSEDHPSDKATVSYALQVPAGWRAVANGRLAGVDSLGSGRTVWHWRQDEAIPVYTMVMGAGRISVTPIGLESELPQSLWTFPEDSAYAVEAFRRAPDMVQVYTRTVGPYPYDKLAHVQSSTRFGGMENSSAIFYSERAYASRRVGEGLIAHETAHQWFGDAVTEYDWHHAWLSEGFASYFGPMFFELIGEDETFASALTRLRESVFQSDVRDRPIIDTMVTDYMQILNANTYQKGASVLHMLRREVGDSTFFRGIREYYDTFRHSTALSSDLRNIMSRQANRSLTWFFEQWLTQPGYPQIAVQWQRDRDREAVAIDLSQVQPQAWGTYRLTVDVEVRTGAQSTRAVVQFDGVGRSTSLVVPGVTDDVDEVVIDPDGKLLLLEVVRLDEASNQEF